MNLGQYVMIKKTQKIGQIIQIANLKFGVLYYIRLKDKSLICCDASEITRFIK